MAEITVFYEGPIVTRAEAKARGLSRYFTGKPCKHGHIALRSFPNSDCLRCDGNRRLARPTALQQVYEGRRAAKPERKAYILALQRSETQKAKALAKRRTASALRAKREYNQSEAFRASRNKYLNTDKGRRSRQRAVEARRTRRIGAPGIFTAADDEKLRQRQKACHICGKRFTKSDPARCCGAGDIRCGGSKMAFRNGRWPACRSIAPQWVK
jgi:hypothetical protein